MKPFLSIVAVVAVTLGLLNLPESVLRGLGIVAFLVWLRVSARRWGCP